MIQIEFEKYKDCFSLNKNITTILLYGDLNKISDPKITVFIPTYKRYKFLKLALNSVLKQNHTKFLWDIIILDNEPYNGYPNENEKYIRNLNNPRILYYRNSENLNPGDNFNRGIELARGEWITFLHDDDLLVNNALVYLGYAINYCNKLRGKPLGAICALNKQFRYDIKTDTSNIDLETEMKNISSIPMNFNLNQLKRSQPIFTPYIGCCIPTCGTTFNKKAVLNIGGFNKDLGICGDQFLIYNLEKKYRVYNSGQVLGFWRCGNNSSMSKESFHNVPKNLCDFKRYIYRKNIINRSIGILLENSHVNHLIISYIGQIKDGTGIELNIRDFDFLNYKKEKLPKFLIACVIEYLYKEINNKKAIRFGKRALKYIKKREQKDFVL